MKTPQAPANNTKDEISKATSPTFELRFEAAEGVDPLQLVGNASLALHHHMAPADGGFDLEADED